MHAWRSLEGPRWSANGFLPTTLSAEAARVSRDELKAIPEYFYSKTGLPVITPANVTLFINRMRCFGKRFILWTWCSGSSRLALTMLLPPFSHLVLFPVDLRYGWDIGDHQHQQLLLAVDSCFLPATTTFEFRCKYWSRAGNRRQASETKRLRLLEHNLLTFGAQHILKIHQCSRRWLVENPDGSALFTESPIRLIDDLVYNDKTGTQDECCQKTAMCSFSPLPDGKRSRKLTKLKSNIRLRHCIKKCRCLSGHIELKGPHPTTGLTMTAMAALYHYKFCVALCKDIVSAVGLDIVATTHTADVVASPADAHNQLDTPEAIQEQLRKIDTSSITIEGGSAARMILDDKRTSHCFKAWLLHQLDAYMRASATTPTVITTFVSNKVIKVNDKFLPLLLERMAAIMDVVHMGLGIFISNEKDLVPKLPYDGYLPGTRVFIHGGLTSGRYRAELHMDWHNNTFHDYQDDDTVAIAFLRRSYNSR